MNVTCPNCATVYRVDPAKVPEAGRARAVQHLQRGVRRQAGRRRAAGRAAAAGSRPARRPASAASAPAPAAGPSSAAPAPAAPATPAAAAAPARAAPRAGRAPSRRGRSHASRGVTGRPPAPPSPPRPAGFPPPTVPARRASAGGSPAPAAAFRARRGAPRRGAGTCRGSAGSGGPASAARTARARPAPATGSRPINPFLSQDPALKARRLARALISDMVVYHPAKRQDGLRDGNLKELFEDEIRKSWEEYAEQVGRDVADVHPVLQGSPERDPGRRSPDLLKRAYLSPSSRSSARPGGRAARSFAPGC